MQWPSESRGELQIALVTVMGWMLLEDSYARCKCTQYFNAACPDAHPFGIA
jgi:hypothetical protein